MVINMPVYGDNRVKRLNLCCDEQISVDWDYLVDVVIAVWESGREDKWDNRRVKNITRSRKTIRYTTIRTGRYTVIVEKPKGRNAGLTIEIAYFASCLWGIQLVSVSAGHYTEQLRNGVVQRG